MYIVQYVRIHLVCLEVKMTPNKELLNAKSYPFHQDYKVQIALLLIEHRWQHVSPIPGPVACFASHLCSWHTNNLFSYIPSQCHGMPPTLRNARHISQISENARHIFQNIKYIIPVVYFASHLILCCWHTNHLLFYPWNLRRKPFGFLESADCKN